MVRLRERPAARSLGASALIITLWLVAVFAGSTPSSPQTQLVGYGSSVGSRANGAFTITGSRTGLYPGASVPMILTVHNPNTVAITVTSVTTTVSGGSKTCAPSNVTVSRYPGKRKVGAKNFIRVSVTVKMNHAAPNACQGTHFVFRYKGFAT